MNRKKRTFRRAIARISLIILLIICAIGTANVGAANQLNSPMQLAQASSIDSTVARATLNHLLQNAQNPRQQPDVYRTIIEGNYALATWSWGESGGQTVLAKRNGQWTVLTSGGGAVDVATLEEAGMPANVAQRLVERDQAAWQQ